MCYAEVIVNGGFIKMNDIKEVTNTNNVSSLIAILAMVFALFFCRRPSKRHLKQHS